MTDGAGSSDQQATPSRASGLLYGLGLGGFLDGIVLHEILQWHHMVSDVQEYPIATVAGLEANTLADGFFPVATWFLVLAASVTALTAWRKGHLAPNWSFHFGLVLTGRGILNVVGGLIDHHILGIHHVRDDLGAPLVGPRFPGIRHSADPQRLDAAQARSIQDATVCERTHLPGSGAGEGQEPDTNHDRSHR